VSAVSRAAAALALVAAPLAAQAPGLPVHGGGFRSGLELAATMGWAGAESPNGDATTYAATLAWGWSRVGVAGTLGVIDGALSEATIGALIGVRLFGDGVETPFEVSAFGGAGTLGGATCATEPVPGSAAAPCDNPGEWRIPLGGAVALAITTPYVSIRPWLAPRAEIFSLAPSEGSATRAAGSAGVDLRFAGGLGARLMWDKVDGYDSVLGLGLSYRF
jgi:hypothetical protein